MSRDKIIKLTKAAVFCIILICLVRAVSYIVEDKTSIDRMEAFYEESNDIDVLFVGTSHIRYTILPMELWHNYGITSYDICGSFASQLESYRYLVDALEYAEPDLVVLDGYKMSYNERSAETSFVHAQLDAMPMSINKIKTIFDLKEDINDRMQLFWDFAIYHSRWKELNEEDFKSKDELINYADMGSTPNVKDISDPPKYDKLDKNEKIKDYNALGLKYLRKSIEECQKRGIDVLLVYMPFPAKADYQREANTAYDLADEYGINYINFLDTDVIDYKTDCLDYNTHLNISGSYKVTEYIGKYIKDNYGIADHRQDSEYDSWNGYFDEYVVKRIEDIRNTKETDNYLMQLSSKNVSSCIYVDKSLVTLQRDRMVNLLKNASQYRPLEKLDEAISTNSSYFLIVDNGAQQIYEIVGEGGADIPNTTFGHVQYGFNENHEPFLYIQDGDRNYLEYKSELNTVVINKYLGSIDDVASFTLYENPYYGLRNEH